MVVYLTIDGEYLLAVAAEQRLATGLGVDDRQAFMGEDGGVTCIDTAPVGTTVSYLLTHTQCFVTELAHRAANVENGYNSTHIFMVGLGLYIHAMRAVYLSRKSSIPLSFCKETAAKLIHFVVFGNRYVTF